MKLRDHDASGVTNKTPNGVEPDALACTPSSAVTAAAARVVARVAIERDDRAAISERVPRCLPSNRGNKTRRAVQARGGVIHTTRTGTGAGGGAGSPVTAAQWMQPHMVRTAARLRRTCSRIAAGPVQPRVRGRLPARVRPLPRRTPRPCTCSRLTEDSDVGFSYPVTHASLAHAHRSTLHGFAG